MSDSEKLEFTIYHNGAVFKAPMRGKKRFLKERAFLDGLVAPKFGEHTKARPTGRVTKGAGYRKDGCVGHCCTPLASWSSKYCGSGGSRSRFRASPMTSTSVAVNLGGGHQGASP